MISTKYTIREHNEARILQEIITKKQISRADLANRVGLNKASVSAITKQLLDDGLITETGIGDASQAGGRKPILLTFAPHCGVVIAVDLGANYAEGLLSYPDGEVIATVERKRQKVTSENAVPLILAIVAEVKQHLPQTRHGIVGMTVAVHGLVHEQQIGFAPYYDLTRLPLAPLLEEQLGFPVILQNEANLAALGEYTYASASDNLISISVHSGVGAGVVVNGQLDTGAHGQIGEIGHTILYPGGTPCPCGNHGCLEQYVSNTVIYREATALVAGEINNSEQLAAAWQQHPELLAPLLKEKARLLAIGINNLVMLQDPELVVINSSVYRKLPWLIAEVQQGINSRFAQQVKIRNTRLAEQAVLIGGIASTARQFLKVSDLQFGN
ncbi:ROK family transcriptional regulator [Enterococcus sp. AD013-P3]|uniref:ROK family transcriptional regulator n=1 Tax=Enterococcus sp. AD013-P3 TaxID=3411036 RepID=UPI003B930582